MVSPRPGPTPRQLASAPRAAPDAGSVSARIDFLRLVLILGIMVIHIPYSAESDPYAGGRTAFDWAVMYLRDGVFRAGVPALSVISGWLLAQQTSLDYVTLLRKKGRTILVPFLCFNLGAFAAVFLLQVAGGGTFWPDLLDAGRAQLLDLAFGLTAQPINFPLYFLRDMIVCMLFVPLFFFGARRAPWTTFAFLLFLVVLGPRVPVWADIQGVIILRPAIALFLFGGIVLGLRRVDMTRLDGHAPAASVITILAGAAMTLALDPRASLPPSVVSIVTLTAQVLICAGIWTLSARLIRLPWARFTARHGSKAFWLFCTHAPTLTLLYTLWLRTGLPYPLFYVLSVPVAVAMLLAIRKLLVRFSPRLTSVAIGARTA